MPRKFIYLINPISGTKDKDAVLELIKKRTLYEKIPFEVLATVADGNYGFLLNKIRQEAITDVIICGGDGTINKVTDAVKDSAVNIGIVPMGSGNGLALTAGIPADAGKALDIIFAGKAAFVDGFYINKQFSCMLCGLGFDAQVAHDFAKQSKRGLMTYVAQTIKNFFSARPYQFVVHIKDLEIKTDAFFISIANSNQFGNNVTIAPRASISDGLLDIVIVNKMSKLRLLYSLTRQITAGKITNTRKQYRGKDIFYFQVKKLDIDNIENAPLHIDGDPAETASRFSVGIVEKAFKLLQP